MREQFIKEINEFSDEAHENAVAHGWWEKEPSFGDLIALCHSELSEALEEYRKGGTQGQKSDRYHRDVLRYSDEGKPEGILPELADVILRILDMCGKNGWDIGRAIIEKHDFNVTRPYKHGGKII